MTLYLIGFVGSDTGKQVFGEDGAAKMLAHSEERKKALGEMTKEELCELLLDARAEAELLKKLHALVEAKKARLRGTPRKSSKD